MAVVQRDITGTAKKFNGDNWANARVRFELLTDTAADGSEVYPIWTLTFLTESDGSIPSGVSLAAPDSGSYQYRIQIGDNEPDTFYLEAGDGSSLTISEVLALAGVSGSDVGTPQAQWLVDQYALAVAATAGNLAEFNADNLLADTGVATDAVVREWTHDTISTNTTLTAGDNRTRYEWSGGDIELPDVADVSAGWEIEVYRISLFDRTINVSSGSGNQIVGYGSSITVDADGELLNIISTGAQWVATWSPASGVVGRALLRDETAADVRDTISARGPISVNEVNGLSYTIQSTDVDTVVYVSDGGSPTSTVTITLGGVSTEEGFWLACTTHPITVNPDSGLSSINKGAGGASITIPAAYDSGTGRRNGPALVRVVRTSSSEWWVDYHDQVLLAANNLSDVADADAALSNLGGAGEVTIGRNISGNDTLTAADINTVLIMADGATLDLAEVAATGDVVWLYSEAAAGGAISVTCNSIGAELNGLSVSGSNYEIAQVSAQPRLIKLQCLAAADNPPFGTTAEWMATVGLDLDEYLPRETGINNVSSSTTVQAAWAGNVVQCDGTLTLTLPDGMAQGFQIAIVNVGTGTITVAAATTLRSKAGLVDIADQWAGATAYHRGSNEWVLMGDLS